MDSRPVNLNLFSIRFPITAIVSILHRISGVFLFFLIPLLLAGLQWSLTSEEAFNQLQHNLSSPLAKVFSSLFFLALIYHLLAGIRHLLMDCGWGESKQAGKCSAYILLLGFVVFMIALGIVLW